MTTIEKPKTTTIIKNRLKETEAPDLKEPKLHAVFLHSKNKYVCENTIIDSLRACVNPSVLIQSISKIVTSVEYNKLIQCTKPLSKEVSLTLKDTLNKYLASFTDNNECYCGSNIEYVIQEIN